MNAAFLARRRAVARIVAALVLVGILDAEPRIETVAASPASASIPAGFV